MLTLYKFFSGVSKVRYFKVICASRFTQNLISLLKLEAKQVFCRLTLTVNLTNFRSKSEILFGEIIYLEGAQIHFVGVKWLEKYDSQRAVTVPVK